MMDPSLYKDFTTSRDLTYHYFYHPASKSTPNNPTKPTLLLLHGFPSISTDWNHVAKFFSSEGYGIVVPDLLGYGGSCKPTDPSYYRLKLLSQDIIDLLDSLNLPKVISISHDWGSGLNSRLVNYYPERISAAAFFAVGYYPPSGTFDLEKVNAVSVERNGYARFGYWKFFVKDGADKVVEKHLDSFFTLLYSSDDSLAKYWCPEGSLEEWLLADRKAEKLVISDEEKQIYIDFFAKNGFAAPFCWYKAAVHKFNAADEAELPESTALVNQPVFFGGASRDTTSPHEDFIHIVEGLCPNHTVKVFDTSHWVLHERPDEVNGELKKWLDGLQLQETKGSRL